jgi:riboflavin biosynthesis pyrimidine reductase
MAELVRRHEMTRVLVEAGPTILGTLVREGLADEAHVYIGGMVVGDERARHAAAGNVSGALGEVRRMALWRVRELGGDVVLTYGSA